MSQVIGVAQASLTDEEIHNRLVLIHAVYTPKKKVINEIIEVGIDKVKVKSNRTGAEDPTITFNAIRNDKGPTNRSRVILAFRQILGLKSALDRANQKKKPR